jgi:hypothetical protein
MAYRKTNNATEVRRVEKALENGADPCSICKGLMLASCVFQLADIHKVNARKARSIRRARRGGNVVPFPVLAESH